MILKVKDPKTGKVLVEVDEATGEEKLDEAWKKRAAESKKTPKESE